MMSEVDYQLALLLQHKLEQDELQQSRNRNINSADFEIAKSLQEQFEKENAIEQPNQNLVYKNNKSQNSTKSLTDPSWEVIDPTPDIHMLFIAFSDRFFWNKLQTVCVSWSKRMTTCAGICSYQGRGGMCSITLSEPLLKLRPRKDLVETLLHEMIHAYLFVTHNNRDRDGHGPEFHKHMYRINGEAGTNITVYHDFHDEVRLYKQHWWRCDGACQQWKPYFGMVRRAMNRAPGPADRWWGEHSRSCGGTFIKVKEPEKIEKKASAKTKSKSKENNTDIRNYISGTFKPNIQDSDLKKSAGSTSHIKTLANVGSSSQVGTVISSKVNNIAGFTNLAGTSDSKHKPNLSKGLYRLNGSTIVQTKRNNEVTQKSSSTSSIVKPNNILKPVRSEASAALSKGSHILNGSTVVETKQNNEVTQKSSSTSSIVKPNNILKPVQSEPRANLNCDNEYSVVRNHWVNKFANNKSSETSTKRKPANSWDGCSKAKKTSAVNEIANEMVECPVCANKILTSNLNTHLDDCLSEDPLQECVICGTSVPRSDYEKHVIECTEQNGFNDDVFEKSHELKCEYCRVNIENSLYSEHVKKCKTDNKKDSAKKCAVCAVLVPSTEYDVHMERCLHKMYDEMEQTYKSDDEMVSCLACDKKIHKSDLNAHLEDCMNMSNIFDDESEPSEVECKETKYNCPFCMKLVSEIEMNSHINGCLGIVDDAPHSEQNKTILLDLLSSDDSF